MIYRLQNTDPAFPDPRDGEPDGLFAIGGALTPEWLLTAYSYGIFPWSDFRQPDIFWYCPMQRFVIFPKEIHVSHSMRQLINKQQYRVTISRAFREVMEGCSKAQGRYDQEGAWLDEKIIAAYTKLYEMGYAASVEVWEEDRLVGGLYGVVLGNSFFGESMFSLVPSASKLALIALADILAESGGIIDCQLETPHLRSMGGRYISYDEYLKIIWANQDANENVAEDRAD